MICFLRYISVAFNDYRTVIKQNFKHLGKGEGTHQVKGHLQEVSSSPELRKTTQGLFHVTKWLANANRELEMENWPHLRGYFEPAQKNRKKGRRKNKNREEKKGG